MTSDPQPDPETCAVRDEIIASLGDDLAALLWHGSRARGEANEESDHDMIVILRDGAAGAIERLAGVFASRQGWSAYVKTEGELRQYPMTGRLQFHHGLLPLHGDFTPPTVTREGLVEDLRSITSTLAHEARYRLMHGASRTYRGLPDDYGRVRNTRWMYYQAKAAIMAMKARALLVSGEYPLTRAALRSTTNDRVDLELIDAVDRWPERRPKFEADLLPLCLLIDAFATRLAGWLDATHP